MSFPDAFAPDMVLGPDQMLPTVPRGFGERFDLEWKAARAPDKWLFYESRMHDLYDDAIDRLKKVTGKQYVNPFTLPPGKAVTGDVDMTEGAMLRAPQRDDVIAQIHAELDAARGKDPKLPNSRLFDDQIRGEATKMRQDAARSALAGYGASGLGAFLGAAAGELSHPVNLATLPIGGTYAAANIARTGLLRYLGRNALAEAGVAAASQTAIEIADAPYQERLGTDTGIEDRLERIFIAGAGGAIFGLGLSGLVAAARGLRKKLNPTLDEADALKVAERASLHDGKNPLGPEGVNAHARALETAEVQVAAGRHADVEQIVREEVQRRVSALSAEDAARGRAQRVDFQSIRATEGQSALVVDAQGGLWRAADGHPFLIDELMRARGVPEARIGDPETTRQVIDDVGIAQITMFSSGGRLGAGFSVVERATKEQVTAARRVLAAIKKSGAEAREFQVSVQRRADGTVETASGDEGIRLLERSVRDAGDAPPAQAVETVDPAAITRAIADSAPPVPEKAAATAKAEMEIANARAIAEDPTLPKGKVKVSEDGAEMSAKEALDAASESVKEANFFVNCAMGAAIG
jgi:hypothetical protein